MGLWQHGSTDSLPAGYIPDDFPGLGKDGRRVVAVGHSFGGIVLKAWFLRLIADVRNDAMTPSLPALASQQQSMEHIFLCSVQAIIFIDVPCGGATNVPHDEAVPAELLCQLPWSDTWLDILGKRGSLRGVMGNLENGFQALLKTYNIPSLSIHEIKKAKVGCVASFFELPLHELGKLTMYASNRCAVSKL